MKQKTVLQELISELERQKNNASLRDNIYLDAIIEVCQSKLPKEKEIIIDAYTSGGSYPFSNMLEGEEYYRENYGE